MACGCTKIIRAPKGYAGRDRHRSAMKRNFVVVTSAATVQNRHAIRRSCTRVPKD